MFNSTFVRSFRAVVLAAPWVAMLWLAGCNEAVSIRPDVDQKIVEQLRAGGGSTGEEAADEKKPTSTGWGSLKGRFVFAGEAPKQEFLAVTKDEAICGQRVPNESLVVDPSTKGLANVVIYARKAPRVFQEEGAGNERLFDQKGCLFLSHVFAVRTAHPMMMKNSDGVSHNINISPAGNDSFNQTLVPEATAPYTFKRQLTTPVDATCSIHPWMKAYIIARDDPYFAVSAKDGSFEIKNLPAGEDIEFQVWHEQATQGLQARPDWPKGRFKIQVPADGVQDLQVIEVPATALH